MNSTDIASRDVMLFDISGCHGSEDVGYGLLGYDTVYISIGSGILEQHSSRQHVPLKYLQPHSRLHCLITWKNTVQRSNFTFISFQHNLCCDNCHSHVAMALNLMHYDGSDNWNMLKLAFLMLFKGRYVR